MRTKEEVIQEAWGKYWEAAKDYINEHGWISYKGMCNVFGDGKHPHLYFYKEIQKELDLESYDDQIVMKRPKSLSGIEDNNGWIKIESEDDLPKLPKDCGDYWVYDDDGDIGYYMFNLFDGDFEHVKENGVTHYQPIIKPKPPLY